MVRDVTSDEVWAVIGPLFPLPKATGRPPVERLDIVEATAWRYRTGAPWRDVPERFGNWNTIYKNFNRWAEQGVWARLLEKVQWLTQQRGELDWVASIDSTIVRVHQHGATLSHDTGARSNYKKFGPEPPDHAIGRSRGGLTTKSHLVCRRPRSCPRVRPDSGPSGRHEHAGRHARPDPRRRVGRQAAAAPGPGDRGQGLPVTSEPAWLRRHGIAASIPERDDQIAHRRKKPGRPIDFGDEQRQRYRGRNVVERCFSRLKQWRGIAMRSDKTARNYHAGLCLAATLQCVSGDAIWCHGSGIER